MMENKGNNQLHIFFGCTFYVTIMINMGLHNLKYLNLTSDKHSIIPSYALAALTRLDHSRPQAVSGRGMSPGSSLLRGGALSLTSVRDNSDADNGTGKNMYSLPQSY